MCLLQSLMPYHKRLLCRLDLSRHPEWHGIQSPAQAKPIVPSLTRRQHQHSSASTDVRIAQQSYSSGMHTAENQHGLDRWSA
jgi:hypothetical protein